MMNKKERLEMDTLKAKLDAESQRAELGFKAYRTALYELVDLQIKIDRIKKVMAGEE